MKSNTTPYILESGKPVTQDMFPSPVTASFLRTLYREGKWRNESTKKVRTTIQRAQVPCCVTMSLEMTPLGKDRYRSFEMFCHVPVGEPSLGVTYAKDLLEKYLGQEVHTADNLVVKYPNVIVATQDFGVDDTTFDACYAAVRKFPHKASGDPEDPIAFAAMSDDVRFYRTEDPNKDVQMTADIGNIVNRRDPDKI